MPVRTCVACRQRLEQAELVRIRATAEGLATGPGDGRGAWVGPSPVCLDLAIRRQAVSRALRTASDANQLARLADSWPSEPVACPHAGS